MRQANFKPIPLNSVSKLTPEENKAYEDKVEFLTTLGVDIRCYRKNTETLKHPDGIHNYNQDSALALNLVLTKNEELPNDLKERLLYYKSIIDTE